MKGTILDFSIQESSGVISSDDGARYSFHSSEWKSDKQPSRGLKVDFALVDGNATGVYLALGADPKDKTAKNKITACLLAFFLGGFGAHKFYMGSWGWGIIYILLCWTYIPAIIALVEFIKYLTIPKEDFQIKAQAFQDAEKGPFGFFW
ncbi:NINE protein [Photobacterium carnosum]|nr:NINE protein [Photobacterium carnosum]MCF2306705.1 NINE protein [Photobacterium carnosum]